MNKEEYMKYINRRFYEKHKNDKISGYNGILYTLDELKELCPKSHTTKEIEENPELKAEQERLKKYFEKFYNYETRKGETGNLSEEIFIRLTQEGYTKYFVSNCARVKIEMADDLHVLKQDDEQGKFGYLILDPKKEFAKVDHKTYAYTLVAYAFLGKIEGDGKHVHHIDNNGYNCRPENLILLDAEQHSYVHGFPCGNYKDSTSSECN